MWLLRIADDGTFSLVDCVGNDSIPYTILSHTWGKDHEEVTFKDLQTGLGAGKAGYQKIQFCADQTRKDGLRHFWVDTCCIDKTSSAELSEAINSMFRWYQNSERCYVYLSDVSFVASGDEKQDFRAWESDFRKSRWFTRGWTLQELIAPKRVEFFSVEGHRLDDRLALENTLQKITGIQSEILRGKNSLSQVSVEERFAWSKHRQTKREEDEAYSLLGIFNVHMTLIYGEGRQKAFRRLRKEIAEEEAYAQQESSPPTTKWMFQNC
ncbi:HET-domain-containing protein [Pyrenochaeta sp. DS3sAY3a]|nr:HET-domain-containing protein [Pyrenochaeta sp. DS3sAY3a]